MPKQCAQFTSSYPPKSSRRGAEGNRSELGMRMLETRDAAVKGPAECTAILLTNEFVPGQHSPCLFRPPVTGVSIMVHGYGFIAVGNTKGLVAARETLDKY